MTPTRRFFVFLLPLLLARSGPSAATGSLNPFSGMDAMPLMQIGLNSRVNGLSGAFCAAADDVSALSVNPAGLQRLDRYEINFVHFDWLEDTSIQSLTWAQPWSRVKGVVAANVTWLSVPEFVRYDRDGYEDGRVSFRNMVLSAAYATRLADWAVGAQLRSGWVGVPGTFAAGTVGLDLGVQRDIPEVRIPVPWRKGESWAVRPLTVGASLLNVATPVGRDWVAWRFRAGLKAPILDTLFVTLDVDKPIYRPASLLNADWRVAVGAEYAFRGVVYIRGGLRLGQDLNFLTLGAGIRYRFGLLDAMVDYVHLPYRAFGPVNNFSVDTKFESLRAASPGLSENRQKMLELHYFRGLTHYGRNDFDAALAEWEKALEIDPENKVILRAVREAKERRERFRRLRERMERQDSAPESPAEERTGEAQLPPPEDR